MTSTATIPTAPGGLPLLGHLIPLVRDRAEFLRLASAQGDNLVRIGLGPMRAVLVCDPELTDYVLRHDRVFDKGGQIFERLRESVGNGLVTCPYSAHRRQRRLVQPLFGPTMLAAYAEAMSRQVDRMMDSWHAGQVLDIPTEMQTLTSTTTAAVLFSDSLSEAAVRQALDDITTVFAGTFRRSLTPPLLDLLPTRGNRGYQRAIARLRSILAETIAGRRRTSTDRDDLLAALLAARDDNGNGLTDTEICDQVITFFLGGTETTATTLSWALLLLDEHPEAAERLQAEADSVLGNRRAGYGDLTDLAYTGHVVTETLRLRGPIWFPTRVTTQDTELAGHLLPAGTTVIWSPYLVHHRPDLYPEPSRFDPDRWDPAAEHHVPREAIIPFGAGARKCIADNFAMLQATLTLATIATRWRLHACSDQDTRIAMSLMLRPRRLRMRAAPRGPATVG